ncbi:MAG: hypothetical protein ACYTGX_15980, partial [Planctomycetota bacterium]|jgi:outer membrane biosynthesis protein TonB
VDDAPAAAASAAGGGADLFASGGDTGAIPFAGLEDEEPAPAAAAAAAAPGGPRVEGDDALTGQRNENSVLFSLSNLQALATGSGSGGGAAPATAGDPEKPGMASGEGSGLIDIRALASASAAVAEPATNGSSKESVDELLAVGGGGGGFNANLAAPVAPETEEGPNKMMIGMVAAIVLLLGAVAFLALSGGDDAAPATAAAAPEGAAATAAAAPGAAAPAAAPAAQAPAAEQPEEDEPEEDEPEAARSAAGSSAKKSNARRKKKKSNGSSRAKTASAPSAPEPAPAPKKRRSSGDESLDSLLASALDGASKPRKKSAPKKASSGSSLPATPSRGDVGKALKRVARAVKACGKGQSGVAMTKITVSGATGRVTNAQVSGSFGGSPVGSCVARTVRSKARFPKFKNPTLNITYPFKL